ncbi:MAG TPA: biotin transporter BioY [Vicinamibacterales bacterium]|jgi:biotin transport system substrate-specific component|nr:biotin transporter BioY [Vicinamibacterales bacterium]
MTSSTLLHTVAARRDHTAAIRFVSMLFITALTAAAAQISIPLPFTAVPFTFQPMVVLLGGLALGSRLGATSQVLYLALGIIGLPVFAASPTLPPGALRLLGPTGGYLMSYPVAAFAVGYLAERGFDRRYVTSVMAMVAGLAIVYACGVSWLGLFARVNDASAATGLRAAFVAGVAPFVLADVTKLLFAAAIVPGLWRLVGRAH